MPNPSHIEAEMRRTCLAILASLLALTTNAQAQGPTASARGALFQFCQEDVPRFDTTSFAVDSAHPRYFVEVFEVSRRGHARTVLTSRPDLNGGKSRSVCERVNYPIDRDGKIVIRINRDFLLAANFEGNFSISARIEGQGTSRAIEVPGYSVIGEEAQVAPVGVAAASTMDGILRELDRHWGRVRVRLLALRRNADTERAQRTERMSRDASSVRALERLLAHRIQARDSLLAIASDTTRPDSASTRGQIANALASVTATRDSLQDRREALQQDSLLQKVAGRPEFVKEALATLRAQKSVRLVLREFVRQENAPLIAAAARVQKRLPAIIINQAATADSVWSFLISVTPHDSMSASELTALDELIDGLQTMMDNLTYSDVSTSAEERAKGIRYALINSVKDAEINVRQTGAQVGDVLVVTFTDSVGSPPSNRSAEIRMQVRDFGLVRRVSDAILLLNLPGQSNEAELRAAALTAESATSIDLPVATRGSPTAGVSYGWVYSPRRDDEYSPLPYYMRAVGSWLEPGFGLVATVANVAMKRITFAPGTAPTEEAAGNEVAYTLGGFTSVFDGALVFSAGWTLNGTRARAYTGIGLSFLSATEKAKELFKGLNP